MAQSTSLGCACGKVRLEVEQKCIVAAECCCNSCREAGARLRTLAGACPFSASTAPRALSCIGKTVSDFRRVRTS